MTVKKLVTDCTTCQHCKIAVLPPGQKLKRNSKHFCIKLKTFAVRTRIKGVKAVGLHNATTCPYFLIKA